MHIHARQQLWPSNLQSLGINPLQNHSRKPHYSRNTNATHRTPSNRTRGARLRRSRPTSAPCLLNTDALHRPRNRNSPVLHITRVIRLSRVAVIDASNVLRNISHAIHASRRKWERKKTCRTRRIRPKHALSLATQHRARLSSEIAFDIQHARGRGGSDVAGGIEDGAGALVRGSFRRW